MNGKEKQRLRRGRRQRQCLGHARTEKTFSKTERLKQALETADAVLIGAGAGLSRLCGIYIFRGTLSPVFQ